MATTQVRGSTQILDVSIADAKIAAAAGIQTSKLADGANFIKKDGSVAFTADQSLGSHKLTNVTDPTGAQDVATKSYVDAARTGLDVKASVRAGSTGNVTIASPGATIDGVTMAANDRVLLKDQSTGSENGIYVWNGAAAAMTRATDCDENTEVTAGLYMFVEEGTVNADSGWMLTTNNPIVVGTTALTFAQFSGAGQITAGAGLTKTGNTLDVGAGNGIQVNADSVEAIYGLVGELIASAVGDSAAAGTTNKAARIDHKHARESFGAPGSSAVGDTVTNGVATTPARSDHRHGRESFGSPAASAVGDTTSDGVATTVARSDHRHSREAFASPTIAFGSAAATGSAATHIRSDATIAAFDVTAPTNSAPGDAAAVGTVNYAARRDHKHGREAFGSPGNSAVGDAATDGVAATLARSDHKHGREAFVAPTISLGSAAASGAATTLVRSDATIAAFDATSPAASAVGDAAVVGTAAYAARRDHKHAREAFATPAIALSNVAGAGVATTLMRSDATIVAFSDGVLPSDSAPGDANSAGGAAYAARRDHVHGRESYAAYPYTGDGATTTFSHGAGVSAGFYPLVYLNGVLQEATGNDYTLVGNNVVFVTAPANGDKIAIYDIHI